MARSRSVAVSVDSRENDSGVGRAAMTEEERSAGESERRFRRVETMCVGGGRDGGAIIEREKVMRWWSDPLTGVTVRSVVWQRLVKIRSSRLPALCVGGDGERTRSSELRSASRGLSCCPVGRLKSPQNIKSEPSSGRSDTRVSTSSRNPPAGPGGRYKTTMVSFTG